MPLEPSQQGPGGVRQGVGREAGEEESRRAVWEAEGLGECREVIVVRRVGRRAWGWLRGGKVGLARSVEAGPQGAWVYSRSPAKVVVGKGKTRNEECSSWEASGRLRGDGSLRQAVVVEGA